MARKRAKGFLALGWACFESAAAGRTEHVPTSEDYPDTLVRRVSFIAGGDLGWRISALTTPRQAPAPLKIVVVPGAPSWAEFAIPDAPTGLRNLHPKSIFTAGFSIGLPLRGGRR